MAYITKDGEGPYPHHAGDYCGNYDSGYSAVSAFYEDQGQADSRQKEALLGMRFGRPRREPDSSTKTLEDMGVVGLYLKHDRTDRAPGDVLVPTPERMREPSPRRSVGEGDMRLGTG